MKKTLSVLIVFLLLLTSCGSSNIKENTTADSDSKPVSTEDNSDTENKEEEISEEENLETEIVSEQTKEEDIIKDYIKSINRDDIIESNNKILEVAIPTTDPSIVYNLSDNVYIATVLEVGESTNYIPEATYQGSRDNILTPVLLKIEESYKGNYKKGDTVELYFLGGIMNIGEYYNNLTEYDLKGKTLEELTSKYSEEDLKNKYIEIVFLTDEMLDAGKTYLLSNSNHIVFTYKDCIRYVDLEKQILTGKGFNGIETEDNIDDFVNTYFVENWSNLIYISIKKFDRR